jgi:starvation-inducible DNA-binding protein
MALKLARDFCRLVLVDFDFRTIPTFFARMPQTPLASCRTFFLIVMLWHVPHQGKNMKPCDDHPFLHPTRSEICLEIRLYLIALLNNSLACTVDLRSHVKQAAWNVKGREFSQLNDLFAKIANELDAYSDLLAERIAVLGGVACGTVRVAAVQSPLPEYPADLTAGSAHVLAVMERVAPYAAALRASITHAADVEEAGTAAVYTEIVRGVEKRLWGLEAYLQG